MYINKINCSAAWRTAHSNTTHYTLFITVSSLMLSDDVSLAFTALTMSSFDKSAAAFDLRSFITCKIRRVVIRYH